MKIFKSFLLVTLLFSLTGCYKDVINEPPFNQDPNLKPTISIGELKTLYTNYVTSTGKTLMPINSDILISGVVNGDDLLGNWYKEISIQDDSSAIGIKINQNNLYTDFPVGRRIYIKCKGLAMGQYSGNIQLGGYVDTVSDPTAPDLGYMNTDIINTHIIKGSSGNALKADTVLLSQLSDKYQYRLIAIKDAQFESSSVGQYYADGINKADASRRITSCMGGTLEIRTSGYSKLAFEKCPAGLGTITGVYTIYKSSFGSVTKQLRLRDAKEVVMTNADCGSKSDFKTIKELRAMYTGTAMPAGAIKIKGIVISDRTYKNLSNSNVIIQDTSAGITLRFTASHSLDLGDEIEVSLPGGSLEEFNSLLQVNNLPLTSFKVISKNKTVTPRIVTAINDIANNGEAWESTLIKIMNPSITMPASGTFLAGGASGGNVNVFDASGNTTLYTVSSATFANTAIKAGPYTSLTAIVSQFKTTRQILMRSDKDLE